MPGACYELASKGFCPRQETCKLDHNFDICRLCNVIIIDANVREHHIRGKKHLRNVFELSVAVLPDSSICPICNVPIPQAGGSSARAFIVHGNTDEHHHRARLRPDLGLASDRQRSTGGQDADDMEEDEADDDEDKGADCPVGFQRCEICAIFLETGQLLEHSGTPKHKRLAKVATLSQLLKTAKADKFGVAVTPGADEPIDLGYTGPNEALTLPEMLISSRTAGTYKLESVSWASRGNRFTAKVSNLETSNILDSQVPTSVVVTFSHPNAGRFTDRMEFNLVNVHTQQKFLITRTVSAVVGNVQEIKDLEPKVPYVRPPPPKRVKYSKEVLFEREEQTAHKPKWFKKLSTYDIPAKMKRLVEQQGTHNVGKEQFKSTFMTPGEWDNATHGHNWAQVLWAEEIQMNRDIRFYDLKNATLDSHNRFFSLKVPGLQEKRPSVVVGDTIRVKDSDHDINDSNPWYTGLVQEVRQVEVVIRFHAKFSRSWMRGKTYHVHFVINRFPLRRMHQALRNELEFSRLLFPTNKDIIMTSAPMKIAKENMQLINKTVPLNSVQRTAVLSIVSSPPGSLPFIIFGPPGTGKTVTDVEAVQQLLLKKESRILICAPSNTAADIFIQRLQPLGVSQMFRMNAPSRYESTMEPPLRKFGLVDQDTGRFAINTKEKLESFRVVVSTCNTASTLHAVGVKRGHFTHIFIDEAGQATEPDALVPIKTLADEKTNVILSGDPQQLGPLVHSPLARKLGLASSYLTRLMRREVYDIQRYLGISIVKLLNNYRSHHSLLKFSNDNFYKGELRASADPVVTHSLARWDSLPIPGLPLIFHSITGHDNREAKNPSWFNPDEASLVHKYITDIRHELPISDSQIAVIAPYSAQVSKIRALLKPKNPGVMVGSVEQLQGQERRVIILSTVRSNKKYLKMDVKHTLGFVKNPRRMNVALTRAQSLLIVIGDPDVLAVDPLWRGWLEEAWKLRAWKGATPAWLRDEAHYTQAARQKHLKERQLLSRQIGTFAPDDANDDHSAGSGNDEDDRVDAAEDIVWRENDGQ